MLSDRFLAIIRIELMTSCNPPTLYYDGHCPLCSREINKLRKSVCEPISFVDVHEAELSKTQRTQFLKKLHFFKDGKVLVGFEANLSLWLATRYGWFFSVLKLPLIFHFCDTIYNIWAKMRFEARYPDLD